MEGVARGVSGKPPFLQIKLLNIYKKPLYRFLITTAARARLFHHKHPITLSLLTLFKSEQNASCIARQEFAAVSEEIAQFRGWRKYYEKENMNGNAANTWYIHYKQPSKIALNSFMQNNFFYSIWHAHGLTTVIRMKYMEKIVSISSHVLFLASNYPQNVFFSIMDVNNVWP